MNTKPDSSTSRVVQITLNSSSDRPTVLEVDLAAIGAREARMVRQATRIAWSRWLKTFEDESEFDVDSVAVLVWVARMRAGESVALEAVEDDLNYQSDVELRIITDDDEESDPGEEPAGS